MGQIGMRMGDFRSLTPEAFSEGLAAHVEARDLSHEHDWDVARTLAAIVIQPHVSRRVTPKELIPLPGDDAARKERETAAPASTPERFKELTELMS